MGCRGVLILLLITIVGARYTRHFHFLTATRAWTSAQKHCRGVYFDLASFNTPEGMGDFLNSAIFKNVTNDTFLIDWQKAWIGLSRGLGSQEWIWSDTGNNLTNKNLTIQIKDEAEELCVAITKSGDFLALNCLKRLRHFCYQIDKGLVPVLSNMTWSQALSYCRKRYKDMASLLTDALLQRAMRLMQGEGRAGLVWIGLRYMRRYWLWMSSDALEFQVWEGGQRFGPQCPEIGHYCGALNSTSGRWVTMDCEQELPFLCWY